MKKIKSTIPKESWIALVFLWLIFAMNANGRELTNRLLPSIIDTYGITADKAGLIGTVSAIGMCLASLPLARWADNGGRGWQRKRRMAFLSLGYLVFMFLNGLTPLTGTFTMVLIFQFFRGVCSGPGEACEVGLVAEWWPKEKNGLAMGIHHAGYPWGTLLGGLLVTAILSIFGGENWRIAFLVFPILGSIIFFLFWRWCNKKNYESFQAKTREAGMTPPVDETELEATGDTKVKGAMRRALKNPNIIITGLICFLCQFAYISLLFWMTPYLTYCAGYSATAASGLSIVYAITGGLGQIFWGNFADKHGAKKTLTICCAWLIVAFFFIRFININIALLVILQLFLGCCSNAVYPVMYKVVADSSEKGTVVTGNGILTTCMFFGAAIATSVTGNLIELGGGWASMAGYMTGVYTMVGAMVVALVLTILFTREASGPRKGKDFALVSLESCNIEVDAEANE